MKRSLFLGVVFTAFSSFIWGQVEIIKQGDNNVVNDSTIKVYGNDSDEMSQNLYIVNQGPQITLYARRDSLSLPMVDTDNTFCWAGLCYGDTTNISSYSETIAHGDTAKGINEFTGHYFPYKHNTPAFIRYTFYNSVNPNDSVWVIAEYLPVATGIQSISGQNIKFSAPYPNPASSFANFSYSFFKNVQAANLKIFNLLGECVQTLPLNTTKSKAIINVQAIPSGVYICEIEAGGSQAAYQKLIIAH